jgi:hypothetical protein
MRDIIVVFVSKIEKWVTNRVLLPGVFERGRSIVIFYRVHKGEL